MTKWTVITKQERLHADPLELDGEYSTEAVERLIEAVFRCDQMAEAAPDREKMQFDFWVSRGPLRLSMLGLRWPQKVINIYRDAETEAYDQTLRQEAGL